LTWNVIGAAGSPKSQTAWLIQLIAQVLGEQVKSVRLRVETKSQPVLKTEITRKADLA